MTIEESTGAILDLDLNDLDQAADAIALRGRALVEFAAQADPQALLAAQQAGEALIEQLLQERARLYQELRNARSLRDNLSLNLESSDGSSSPGLLG